MQPYSNLTRRNMEDDLNIFENGRRPQFFLKEDDLKFFFKWKITQNKIMQPKTSESKNNNIFENGRRPIFF
jgi:hypothetical protein